MIQKIKSIYNKLDIHTLEVLKKASASTIVKIAGMIVGLLVSVFLGRTIGAEGLGIINLSNKIVSFLIIIGLFGMRAVIIKEVAIAHNNKNYKHIGNVMHTAYWLNGSLAIVLSVILILLSPWLANNIFNEPRLTYPLIIASVVMTPQIFSRVFSSGLIGYRKIWQSNLVEQTLSISITGILLIILWLLKLKIEILHVAITYAIGRIVVTVSVGVYWKTLYNFRFKRKLIIKNLTKISLPLLISSVSTALIASGDTFLLGIYGNSTDIGIYTVAARIALLTSFFLQVTNSAVGPKIAALYESGKIKELEQMLQKVTLVLFFIGLIPLFIFVIAGKPILSIWGDKFTEGYWVLIILSIGQLVNIGTGAVGQLLIMTGNHKQDTKITFNLMIVNIVLNIILIKLYGIIGAAIANTFTIAFINILRVIISKKKTGISILKYF